MAYRETIIIPLLNGPMPIASYEEIKEALGDKIREYKIYAIPPRHFLGKSDVLVSGIKFDLLIQSNTAKASFRVKSKERLKSLIDLIDIRIIAFNRVKNIEKIIHKEKCNELIETLQDIIVKAREEIKANNLKIEITLKEQKEGILTEKENEEKLEYEIWEPNEIREGCVYDKVTKKGLENKYDTLKESYKILIDDRYRSVYVDKNKIDVVIIYREDKKTGKKKPRKIKLKFARYNLLLNFLKHKDELIPVERLYRIGWHHMYSLPEEPQNNVKNEISILNAVFEAWDINKSLKIEPERKLGYRCSGTCTFCLIIKTYENHSETSVEDHT